MSKKYTKLIAKILLISTLLTLIMSVSFFALESESENDHGSVVSVAGASVFTTPGKAPVMPKTVKLITDTGYEYEAEVTWGPIPVECYVSSMSYFRVPGIIKDTNERVFADVTVLSADMSEMALWFDASSGVMLEDGYVSEWIDRVSGVKAVAADECEMLVNDGAVIFDGINDYLTYEHDISEKQNLTIITRSYTNKASTDYFSEYSINDIAKYTLFHYPEADEWGGVWLTTFKNGVACRFGTGTEGNCGIYYGVQTEGWSVTAATKGKSDECIYLNGELIYDRSNDTSGAHSTGSAGDFIANTHAYAYLGCGIENSENYYYEGSVSDIIVFDRTLSSEEVNAVCNFLRAKSEGGVSDYSDIVLAAYEKYLSEKDNVEKVPDSMSVPADPVDMLGADLTVIIVTISAVVMIGAFVVAVVVIKKRNN